MKVSFLIVNYNSLDLIQKAIEAIRTVMGTEPFEIIVHDNGSTDGSREWFQSHIHKDVDYQYSEKNVGYGAGNNLAFQRASGELIVLANPDIGLIQGPFLEFLNSQDLNVGAWGPKVVYPDGNPQANGGGKSTPWTFVFQCLRVGYLVRKLGLISLIKKVAKHPIPGIQKSIVGEYLKNFDKKAERVREWYWMSGAFLVIPRHVYQSVGGFDENFFLYNEDEDLCMAIRNKGFRIIQDSAIEVVHIEGASHKGKAGGRLGRAYVERMKSRVYFAEKHFSKRAAILLRVFFGGFLTFQALVQLALFKFMKFYDFLSLACKLPFMKFPKIEKRMQ